MEQENLYKQSLDKFVKLSRAVKKGEDIGDTIADALGEFEREEYLLLLNEWKKTFKALSDHIRHAKIMRKIAEEGSIRDNWNFKRWQMRKQANHMMRTRLGLKQVARRHWRSKEEAAA